MTSHTVNSGAYYATGYGLLDTNFTLVNYGIIGNGMFQNPVYAVNGGDVVVNHGTIFGDSTISQGVLLRIGGMVTNISGGTIKGFQAIQATSGSATVNNTGSIYAVGSGGGVFGIRLGGGGAVTNNSGGRISGNYGGVIFTGAAGFMFNTGTVTAGTGGVFMEDGGTVLNFASAAIDGTYGIAINGGAGQVSNSGAINGINLGVELTGGGVVSNAKGATITGSLGVHITGGGAYLSNSGAIKAGAAKTAVSFASGFNNTIAMYPGATFTGTVNAGNTIGYTPVSTLKLGSGTSAGTLTGIGAKYIGFTNLTVTPGARWVLASGGTVPNGMAASVYGTLTNNGSVATSVVLSGGSAPALTNASGATMSSFGFFAVYGTNGATATVVNSGQIHGALFAGVGLKTGGSVTNQSLGTISGGREAVYFGASNATVVNSGQLLGGNGNGVVYDGVLLEAGGTVTNLAGSISGKFGIYVATGAANITNDAAIVGSAAGKAVKLAAGFQNQVTVGAGATFTGTVDGGNAIGNGTISTLELTTGSGIGTLTGIGSQYINFANLKVDQGASWVFTGGTVATGATLTEDGTLTNKGSIAPEVGLGGTAPALTNASGATIAGAVFAVYGSVASGAANVVNAGKMLGSGIQGGGVRLHSGGTVTNAAAGYIGGAFGVQIYHAGTVVNYGIIKASVGGKAVKLASGYANVVGLAPSGVFSGFVDGGNPVGSGPISTLVLKSGSSAGTLNGFGTQYINFAALAVAAGATWTLSSGPSIASNQTVTVYGTLFNRDSVSSTVTLGSGAVLNNLAGQLVATLSGDAVFASAGPASVVNQSTIISNAAPGVSLAKGGSVQNSSGTIGGYGGVYISGGAGTVTNYATITANSGKKAVSLASGFANTVAFRPGVVFGGVVDGGNGAGSGAVSTLLLKSASGAGTLSGVGSQYLNFGDITVDTGATWTLEAGQTVAADGTVIDNGILVNNAIVMTAVTLGSGAYLSNASGGVISGSFAGTIGLALSVPTGTATVVNDGQITATLATPGYQTVGIAMHAGGTVTNQSGGTIAAATGIRISLGSGTVTNSGKILGNDASGTGVALLGGGTLTNLAGTISGFLGVQFAAGAGTVINDAVIEGFVLGGEPALAFAPGFQNRLVTAPGATISGGAGGGNTIAYGAKTFSTLELTTGASAGVVGTITGVGPKYSGFGSIVVDTGAAWVMVSDTIAPGVTVTDQGTLTNQGTMGSAVTLAGTASFTNASGATVTSGTYGVQDISGPGTVTNYGLIADYIAIILDRGGTVSNLGGTISGTYGVEMEKGAGKVTNTGTIISGVVVFGPTVASVSLPFGYQNTVAIGPGAAFLTQIGTSFLPGTVQGGNPVVAYAGTFSTLELMTGASAGAIGTISGLGARYVNFSDVVVDAGASWVMSGESLVAGMTLTDNGTLTNDGIASVRLTLGSGALLTNAKGAAIQTSKFGAEVFGGPGTVVNAGQIAVTDASAGDTSLGVILALGGSVTNQAGGTISADIAVGATMAAPSVYNAGFLDGTTAGVELRSGGTVTNAAGGMIGGKYGVTIAGGLGRVLNSGTINSTAPFGASVYLAAGYANYVAISPGAAFGGLVGGGNGIGAGAVSTLELASASAGTPTQGTLSGLGTQFIDFAQVTVAAGASWSMTGQNSLAAGATLQTNGTLSVNGEMLLDGTLRAGSQGLITLGQAGARGSLVIENGGKIANQILFTESLGLDIGQAADGAGDVLVTGTQSLLTNAGEFLVGDAGLGSLEVQSGGTVSTEPGSVASDLNIAVSASASGSSVDLSGTRSALFVGGLLDVGEGGSGALSVEAGATVVATALDAGKSASAVGNITVTDPSSTLNVTTDATVADDGTGVLSVLNGATMNAVNLTIGSLGDSSGAVVVSGEGSAINLSGAINVGTSLGTGDLTIGPGGAVHAKVVNLQGNVVLENGDLDPTVNLINQGQTAGGSGTIAAGDIVDEGVIQAGGSKPSQKLLVVQGTVLGGGPWTINGTAQAQANGGAGILQINAGGTLEMAGPVLNAASTTFTDDVTPQSTYTVTNSVLEVNFADATGVLKLDQIAGFAGTIAAFQKGDSFVITGGTLSGLGVTGGTTLTVADSGHGGTDDIIFASPISASGFSIVNSNTIQVACFAAGTRIGTETGDAVVGELNVGDTVLTPDGRVEPIVWIGQRTVNCARHPTPETVWPVRVRAGAFGENGPVRDLYLSPDHAVFVNGVLIPVKLLLNGTSIVQEKRPAVTYYHVELRRHDVILAEGLTVESYLDLGDRANFAGGETVRLFPDFAARLGPDTAAVWETKGAAPLVMTGNALEAVRRMVTPRSVGKTKARRASGAR